MYKLNISQLEPGDIILERYPEDEQSQKIMKLSESNFSHALLYIGLYNIIEAGDIVKSHNPQLRLYDSQEDVCVLRIKSKYSTCSLISRVIAYARSLIGTEYSIPEAYRIMQHTDKVKCPNRQTCTRLVAQAFKFAGISIVTNPDYCTPKEIEISPYLEKVENIVVSANEEDIELSKHSVMPDIQSEIIECLLSKCRELFNKKYDIQTFSQLSMAVYECPEKIDEIVIAIEESGYLNLWKKDIEKNPQDFDPDKFIEHYKDDSMYYASLVLDIARDKIRLIEHNRKVHEYYVAEKGENKFGRLMIKHYDELLEWTRKRYDTATIVLDRLNSIIY